MSRHIFLLFFYAFHAVASVPKQSANIFENGLKLNRSSSELTSTPLKKLLKNPVEILRIKSFPSTLIVHTVSNYGVLDKNINQKDFATELCAKIKKYTEKTGGVFSFDVGTAAKGRAYCWHRYEKDGVVSEQIEFPAAGSVPNIRKIHIFSSTTGPKNSKQFLIDQFLKFVQE